MRMQNEERGGCEQGITSWHRALALFATAPPRPPACPRPTDARNLRAPSSPSDPNRATAGAAGGLRDGRGVSPARGGGVRSSPRIHRALLEAPRESYESRRRSGLPTSLRPVPHVQHLPHEVLRRPGEVLHAGQHAVERVRLAAVLEALGAAREVREVAAVEGRLPL